ncbi:MAG: HD domain-containing protein [Minisyncoccales bacterium]
MKEIVNFLIKVNRLKEMSRTGWVLAGIKNPETVAEHVFGTAIASWLLGEKKGLEIKKLIQTSFAHEFCEVYAGDITPILYYPKLPEDKEKRKKILMKWARLLEKEKKRIGEKKFEIEKKSFLKLIKPLPAKLKKEFLILWLGYKKGFLKEGKFVRQINRIDTLLQSIVYFGTKDIHDRTNWWEWTEEIVEDELLLDFLFVVQSKFYRELVGKSKGKEELKNILNFLLKINKLKKMPRTLWALMKIKQPETVAGHIFSVTLMSWVFGQMKTNLNLEKVLKMALCHEFPSVYTGDLITPFRIRKEKGKIFQKWPRLSKKEKFKIFFEDFKKEKNALKKLVSKLKPSFKKEILSLWEEYKKNLTLEAHFVNQMNVLAVLLQGLFYKKRYKKLPLDWMWEWAFERCDDPIILEFIEVLNKKFSSS